MNVWISKCRKQATCKWCNEIISKDEFIVTISYYRGKWLVKKYFHPNCWIEQGKEAVMKNPKTDNRGKKRMVISDEDRKKRLRILVRRASVIQRLKKAYEDEDTDEMIHLGMLLHKLREEIEPYGGVPKKW